MGAHGWDIDVNLCVCVADLRWRVEGHARRALRHHLPYAHRKRFENAFRWVVTADSRVDTCSLMVMHGCGPGREWAVCGWGIALMRARTLARTFADGALRLGAQSGTSRWRQVTPQTASVFTRFLALFGRTDGSDIICV